ncbi:MAG: YihY family inner membrane protein [Methyloprofundus sp.]|nr:YihY family inner membrane protein [Methyloprofundus sp.]
MYKTIINYFREGLWLQQAEAEEHKLKRQAICYLRIFTLSAQGFIKDYGVLRASALTLYTLLSIVPIIAMLFGVAKGFGFEEILESQLLEQVPEQNDMILKLIDMAKNMLNSTKGGVVAGFGVVVLFWSVLKVISNIEESFNHIWNVKKPRTIGRKLSDYLSLMILAPIMFIAASSISVYVQTQLASLINAIALPGTVAALQLLSYLPILIYWGLFSFVFIFMPNTTVNYRSGFFAGIIAGTIYQCLLYLYVALQIGVSSYNAIYGSFAALPLFLVWLQITWFIVLFGSELSFFHQNIALYQFNQKYKKLNFSSKTKLAQHMMHSIIIRFSQPDEKPYLSEQLSLQLRLPISIVQSILDELVECQLLSAITDNLDTQALSYQPARDVSLLDDDQIAEALKNNGESYVVS